jgi:hypothetical protein
MLSLQPSCVFFILNIDSEMLLMFGIKCSVSLLWLNAQIFESRVMLSLQPLCVPVFLILNIDLETLLMFSIKCSVPLLWLNAQIFKAIVKSSCSVLSLSESCTSSSAFDCVAYSSLVYRHFSSLASSPASSCSARVQSYTSSYSSLSTRLLFGI